MKISDIDLDSLDRKEYLYLLIALTHYYYVLFNETLVLSDEAGKCVLEI